MIKHDVAKKIDTSPGIQFPKFRLPLGVSSEFHLHDQCMQRLHDRYDGHPPQYLLDRLETECNELRLHGLLTYVLLTADLVQCLRRHNASLTVGQYGGCRSLVGWLMGVSAGCPASRGSLAAEMQLGRRRHFPRLELRIDAQGCDLLLEYAGCLYGWAQVAIQVTDKPCSLVLSRRPLEESFDVKRSNSGAPCIFANDEELRAGGFVPIGLSVSTEVGT